MDRRKKNREELEPSVEEAQSGVETPEDSEKTEKILIETQEEKNIGDVEAESQEERKPNPRRRRRSRRRQPQLQAVAVDETPQETATEAPETPAETQDFAAFEQEVRKDLKLTSTAMEKTMDSMVSQWGAIKEMSSSISTNLERVASLLQDLPTNYATTLHDLAKKNQPKSSPFVTKIVLGASVLAFVLSVVSLTLSQSTRQVLFNKQIAEAPRVDASTKPLQSAIPQVAPSESTAAAETRVFFPEIATKQRVVFPRKSPRGHRFKR